MSDAASSQFTPDVPNHARRLDYQLRQNFGATYSPIEDRLAWTIGDLMANIAQIALPTLLISAANGHTPSGFVFVRLTDDYTLDDQWLAYLHTVIELHLRFPERTLRQIVNTISDAGVLTLRRQIR